MVLKKKLSKRITIKLTLLIFIVFYNIDSKAQYQIHKFGSQGSQCYFSYLCYAPNNNYKNIKRPFVFILGKKNENPVNTFELDTLKTNSSFFNYMFVYVENTGKVKLQLNCIDALVSLLTYGFTYGTLNLFFQINDDNIHSDEIQQAGINKIFKSIHYTEQVNSMSDISSKQSVSEMFKETYIVDNVDEEDFGTFYNTDNQTKQEYIKPKKTYFDEPQKYDFVFTGVVRDKQTGEALPFATVLIQGTSVGVATNNDGYFTLAKVPTDTSTLIIRYLGYDEMEVFLTPFTPKSNYQIEMNVSSNIINSVNIYGNKRDVGFKSESNLSAVSFSPKKLEQLPNLGEKDVMRSFQLMPGVSAANESSSGLYVRGGTPDQNLVLFDGFTVYYVDHLYGFFSAFNSNAIKDVQLYKGGFESKFGGRLSSVTEITGKDGNQKKYNFGGDLSLLSMNVFAELPINKKFTSIITVRRSFKGALYDKIASKFESSDNSPEGQMMPGKGRFIQETEPISYFYDLNGKFSFRPNDKDIFSLSIFLGTDKLDNSIDMSSSSFGGGGGFGMNSVDLTKFGNRGSSLKWSRKWTSKFYGNTVLSYSNFFTLRDKTQERNRLNANSENVTTKNGFVESNDLKDVSLKSEYQWDIRNYSQIQFGVFATDFNINYSYIQNDTATILNKENKSTLSGIYLQNKLSFFDKRITLLPGIRASYFELSDKLYFEPRAAMVAKISEKVSLTASTGKYYQFVNRVIHEDIMSGSKDFWLLSDNDKIPVSSANHFVTGLSYDNNLFLFSAEIYYKDIRKITEYSLRINASPMGVDYSENFFTGNGNARGIELLAQKKTGKLTGWMSYTISEAKNYFSAYSNSYYPANQDVTNEFKIVGMYQYKRFDFSATWIYATGRPYTAPSGAYSITLLDGNTQDFFTVSSKNSLRLPDYHRADISISYKLLYGTKEDRRRKELGALTFSIFNIYNRKNVWYKQFTIEDEDILETNINYMGITPNLTLSLRLW